MSLTDTEINNFIDELRNFSPELERSEIGQAWPESLLEDYSEKGALLERMIEINIALLREFQQIRPQNGNGSPNDLNIVSNRLGLYIELTPNASNRRIWYNQQIGASSGWQFVADRS